MQEGVVQYHYELVPGSPPTESQINELAHCRKALYERDVIGCDMSRYGACYGNVSMRTGPWAAGPGRREFLVSCTQTGGDNELTSHTIVRVMRYDHHQNFVLAQGPCGPSSETMTHGAIYDASLEVRAVVHGHDPHLWRWLLDQNAPHTPYDIDYGTPAMAHHAKLLVQKDRVLPWRLPGVMAMAGHQDGVVAWGASPKHATERFLEAFKQAHGK